MLAATRRICTNRGGLPVCRDPMGTGKDRTLHGNDREGCRGSGRHPGISDVRHRGAGSTARKSHRTPRPYTELKTSPHSIWPQTQNLQGPIGIRNFAVVEYGGSINPVAPASHFRLSPAGRETAKDSTTSRFSTSTMATIQASFASAPDLFNSLLGPQIPTVGRRPSEILRP